jgi:rod shape-determining protein MreC
VPRNRSARLAVLGAGTPRSRPVSYSSRQASALRRRIVAVVLVLLSLVLITIYFRESSNGGLHQIQNGGATVLRPFEVAAERLSRPFRDAYGFFADLVNAKSENKHLRAEVEQLRQQATQNIAAASENAQLRKLLGFRNSTSFPVGYDSVPARIIVRPSPAFEQQVVIDAGKTSGIRVDDPVVSSDGLAGSVTRVAHDTAQVTLLTDDTSAASAIDAETRAIGIVKKGAAGMSFDQVTKDLRVESGDTLVTAGWKSHGLSSIYPPGIPIGRVTFVGQNEVDLYKHIQFEPFTDFKSLSLVLVLIPKHR